MSSKIKLVLIISLILNFLLAGLLIGQYSRGFLHDHGKGMKFSEFVANLPEDKRKFVEEKMNSVREENRIIKEQIRSVKEELREIIAAPEFDEQLYDENLNEMHDLYRTKAKNIADAIKYMAKNMSPEERKQLSEYFEKRKVKHKKGKTGD